MPLKIAQIFDCWLPDTMNWAYRLIGAMPGVETDICAPWIIANAYRLPGARYAVGPMQALINPSPPDEQTDARWAGWLTRAEGYLPLYRNWLKRRFQQQRPDLMHVHFGPVACRYRHLARALDIPLVVTFHGYDFKKVLMQRPAFRAQYKQLFDQAAAVVCGGPYGIPLLEEAGCPRGKITTIALGTQPELFKWVARTKPADRLNLLQVGTMTGKKGFMDTLEAVRLARADCPNLTLTISGERYERDLVQQMQDFIRRYNMESFVQWLDPVPSKDMPAFLSDRFNVFIQPSCTTSNGDLEGGPITVLEAQSTGMPVIATRHFNIPLLVSDGQTGLLAPEHAPGQLADHIRRFYRMQEGEYAAFSLAARKHVAMHYDMRDTALRYAALYRKILGK
jgi:colanic acid/amylovoran biosynthesis glycosyltransferase